MQEIPLATIESMSVSPEAFSGTRSAMIPSGRGFGVAYSQACACARTSCHLTVEASVADPVFSESCS